MYLIQVSVICKFCHTIKDDLVELSYLISVKKGTQFLSHTSLQSFVFFNSISRNFFFILQKSILRAPKWQYNEVFTSINKRDINF